MERMFNEWDDAHAGHRERLRQRVQYAGFEGMPEHEVLEFLLCYAIPRQDVNTLAHALIRRFGSLENVLRAREDELRTVSGMGAKTAAFLVRICALTDAWRALEPEDMPRLTDCRTMFAHVQKLAEHVCPPSAWQLCLSRDLRLLYAREICPSRAWGEPATLREALRDMLEAKAHKAVIVQFIGDALPETEAYDLHAARRYADTLTAARCELSDVLLTGTRGTRSLRYDGDIPRNNSNTDYGGRLAEPFDPQQLRL